MYEYFDKIEISEIPAEIWALATDDQKEIIKKWIEA